MLPYSDFLYFYILTLLLLPAIILGIIKKNSKYYGLFLNLIFIFIIFRNDLSQIKSISLFFIFQLAIIYLFLFIHKRFKASIIKIIFILLSITPLIIVKLGNASPIKTFGFLGISYITFKTLQIIIEIDKNLIKSINLFNISYFILFFPTLSSGPIDRFRRFQSDINNKLSRNEYIELLGEGLWKIVLGIGYKFIIANSINTYLLLKIPQENNLVNIIKYTYSYSLYLFFDFAGYSLIAIGVSYILKIKTPANFNMPFISRNIKDFWNRWHMSLSFWFRDYIYTNFVFSSIKSKIIKNKYLASYLGYIITMGLMGIWHGTSINYIAYGLYHAFLLIITDLFERLKFYRKIKDKKAFIMFSTFITFNLICFGFLIFSGRIIK